jgi:hypothetical protein
MRLELPLTTAHTAPLEAQLQTLASAGVRLNPPHTAADLLREVPREDLERVPYLPLLHLLGSEVVEGAREGPWFSDQVWRFDQESIDGPGAYRRIAERMRQMAAGELPLEGVTDHVDVDSGAAWVEYTLDGRRSRWDAELHGDWVDLLPMVYIAEELDQRGAARRFRILDEGGRYVLIACLTPEEFGRLRDETGLAFEGFVEFT